MMRIFGIAMLLVALLACATAPVIEPGPGDLSLTTPAEYPGYFLISFRDLENVMSRAEVAEEKLRLIYEEHGDAMP